MDASTPGSPFAPSARADVRADITAAWPVGGFGRVVPDDVATIRMLGLRWRAFARRDGGMGEVYLCVRADGPRYALRSSPSPLI